MANQARIDELDSRHQALEHRLKEEQKRPTSDALVIADLKKKKLALKDEINTLKRAH